MRFCQIFYICSRNKFDKKALLDIIGLREKNMPFVCDPPNTVPPAVIQLADKYEYSCAQKFKPKSGFEGYEVYRVLKYNSYPSFILYKENKARYANQEEVKNFSELCTWDENFCLPFDYVNHTFHYIISN